MNNIDTIVHKIDPKKIIVLDRQRKNFKQKPLDELTASIYEIGQLQPGICYQNAEQEYVLIAGERRLRACRILEIPYSFILKEEIEDPYLLKQIELEENLKREDLHWKDAANAKKELHELYQKKYGSSTQGASGGHKISDTAEQLGESVGLVSEDIELALWAEQVPEIANAENKTKAKKIIARLKKGVKRRIALKDALGTKQKVEIENSLSNFSSEQDLVKDNLLNYNKRCLHGKMEEHIEKFSDFDIVLFDPPWGVDFDKVSLETGNTEKYEDNALSFKEELVQRLTLIYNVMSENSHLYMFFGITLHQFVYDSLEEVGFKTNRIPIIWYKKGAHRTRHPEVYPGRCYEPIAYARKGSKPLQVQGAPDIISTAMPTVTIKQDHPSGKHPDIYIELLKRSAFPGNKVLDPMAGSGMSAVACEALKDKLALDWTMIEMNKNFRDLMLTNLLNGYDHIISRKVEPPKDFKQLDPGSQEWMNYWKGHPEEQEAMINFMRENEGD